jgi:linoleoyl-CoA desaturase
VLKQRIDQYFKEQGISKHANLEMVLKTIFFLILFVSLYALILLEVFAGFYQILLAMMLGMTMAFIGFNICHDALHGAYSANKKVNKTLGFLFNVIGANAYMWNITHNIVHHSYTNVVHHDEDIEIAPGLVRVSSTDKWNKLHRYQHIYAFFLYTLTTLAWFFKKDYKKFFQKRIGDSHINKHPRIEYFNLFFYKFIYYGLFIIIPLMVMEASWQQFLAGFLAMNFAEGVVLGLVFQLAHVVEDTNIVEATAENNIEEAWAAHQMKTTANFATKSKLAFFLCGGLNFQVEHHLFPKICHIHYRNLSPIVAETAKEFGLPYHNNETFFTALQSHYQLLKKMGQPTEALVIVA